MTVRDEGMVAVHNVVVHPILGVARLALVATENLTALARHVYDTTQRIHDVTIEAGSDEPDHAP